MFINIILEFLFVTIGDRNVFFSENYSSFVDNFYLLLLDNKRPVHADELVCGELFFHGAHTYQ